MITFVPDASVAITLFVQEEIDPDLRRRILTDSGVVPGLIDLTDYQNPPLHPGLPAFVAKALTWYSTPDQDPTGGNWADTVRLLLRLALSSTWIRCEAS